MGLTKRWVLQRGQVSIGRVSFKQGYPVYLFLASFIKKKLIKKNQMYLNSKENTKKKYMKNVTYVLDLYVTTQHKWFDFHRIHPLAVCVAPAIMCLDRTAEAQH